MERFTIIIKHKKEDLQFEVADYLHHTNDHCKFEVFADDQFIASFEPDQHSHLHVCKNANAVNQSVLNLIADKLEGLPHPINVVL